MVEVVQLSAGKQHKIAPAGSTGSTSACRLDVGFTFFFSFHTGFASKQGYRFRMRASTKFSDANMLALHFWQMSCSIRTKRSDKPALQRSSKVSRLIRSKTWVDPNLLSKALFVNRRTRKLHIKKHVCSKEVSFQSRTLTETMLFMLLRGSQRRPIRARA